VAAAPVRRIVSRNAGPADFQGPLTSKFGLGGFCLVVKWRGWNAPGRPSNGEHLKEVTTRLGTLSRAAAGTPRLQLGLELHEIPADEVLEGFMSPKSNTAGPG